MYNSTRVFTIMNLFEWKVNGLAAIISLFVFIIVYFFIITEKINRTVAAMLGAVVIIILHVFGNEVDIMNSYVDFKTLFLLIGMMILVSVIKKSQFFEWVAFKLLKTSKGSVMRVFILLNVFVALFSALMDNVTTLLIFIPITLAIVDLVKGDAMLFIISEILCSNIGGTATLIGDPPNILIGSAAKLSFFEFATNTGPISFIVLIAAIALMMVLHRKKLKLKFDTSFFDKQIEVDVKKLRKASIILLITIFLFLSQEIIKLENWVIALGMGFLSVLILDSHKLDFHFKEVEWETIFFFMGLFILTGALEDTGVLRSVADFLESNFGMSLMVFAPVLYTFSFFLSGFVDNIPFTATMIPVIKHLPEINSQVFSNLDPIWWSLSVGVCMGGNLTAIGASANVVAISLMKKHYGSKMSFTKYFLYALPVTMMSWGFGLIYTFIIAS